jgi:hypothetical protein
MVKRLNLVLVIAGALILLVIIVRQAATQPWLHPSTLRLFRIIRSLPRRQIPTDTEQPDGAALMLRWSTRRADRMIR